MLSLAGLQSSLTDLYRIDVDLRVDDFVRALHPADPEAHRREVVLVAPHDDGADLAVLLAPEVFEALRGRSSAVSRFDAWCVALEAVSHFTRIAWRAARDEPVSQLDLELQADVDKYLLGVAQRCVGAAPELAHRRSRALRHALYDRARFIDHPGHERGARYRLAHHMAARYAASLERRYVRHGRFGRMVDELRRFWRAGADGRRAMTAR